MQPSPQRNHRKPSRRKHWRTRVRFQLSTFWEALRTFDSDHPFQLAAALSYYTVLSLAPLMLVIVSMAGLIFGRDAVEGHLVTELRGLVGDPGAELVQSVLGHAMVHGSSVLSLTIGLVSLFLGATTVFIQLQDAVNHIWHVEARHEGGYFERVMRKRLISLAMVLAVGFLLLVSLVLSAALSAFGNWASGSTKIGAAFPYLLQGMDSCFSFVVITLLFAMLFRYLPDVELEWRDVAFGSLLTAALFTLGKTVIGFYLGGAGVGTAYGAAGSVVVFLVWVYYAALILFLGVKLTAVRTERRRGHAEPEPHAVAVEPEPVTGRGA
jgi:membrane protein